MKQDSHVISKHSQKKQFGNRQKRSRDISNAYGYVAHFSSVLVSASNRTAIVTGASRGIGRAIAIRLSEDFANIVLVARNEDALVSVSGFVHANGANVLPLALDLREASAADTVISRTLERFGRIDTLINVAGAVPQADLFEMSDEEWADGLSLKFHGARRMALRAWPSLRQTQGSLVFFSGSSAITPKANFAAVGTINAAICALAKVFAERGIAEGIQVNSVLPGPVNTDRRRSMLQKYAVAHGIEVDQATEAFAKEAGIARFGKPEEIAALVAFLVSPQAHWMTGAMLRMDGGEVKAV